MCASYPPGNLTDFIRSFLPGHQRGKQDEKESGRFICLRKVVRVMVSGQCLKFCVIVTLRRCPIHLQHSRYRAPESISSAAMVHYFAEHKASSWLALLFLTRSWVISIGHQGHLSIKYFNCHISLSFLFPALDPRKLL